MELLKHRTVILAICFACAGLEAGSKLVPSLRLLTGWSMHVSGAVALGFGVLTWGWSGLMLADVTRDDKYSRPGGGNFSLLVALGPTLGALVGALVGVIAQVSIGTDQTLITSLVVGICFGAMAGAAFFWTWLCRAARKIRRQYVWTGQTFPRRRLPTR